MKDAIKKLTDFVNIGFSAIQLAEAEVQLIQVIQEVDTALLQGVCESHPEQMLSDLMQIAVQLAHLIYTLLIRSGHSLSHKKIIQKHITYLYARLQQHIQEYGFTNAGFMNAELLPPQNISKKIERLVTELDKTNSSGVVSILQPCTSALYKLKYPSFYQWLWWCSFYYHAIQLITAGETGFLENLLVILDFNTPSFKHLLLEKFKHSMADLETMSEKTEFLRNEIIRYNSYTPLAQYAYNPGTGSVKQYMLDICKIELELLYITATHSRDELMLPKRSTSFTLQTGLSVPQAALLVRLLVGAGMIKSDNHTALLKSLADILSTPRTSEVSAESLRVKFYTPDKAAKDILKDYLFMMLNQLKTFD